MGIVDIIDAKIDENDIISVFCNPEDNYSTVTGFAADADENFFVLKHVTAEGRYDGYVLRRKDQVFRIDYETSYETDLHKLYMYYKDSHEEFSGNGNVMTYFLEFAKQKGFVVGIGIRDYDSNSVLGIIEKIDLENKMISLHQINDQGRYDGYAEILFESIYRICADGAKEQKLKILNAMLAK